MQRTSLIFIASFALILSSCGKPSPTPPSIPQGEQTFAGTLLPYSIDVLRRGTHLLKMHGIRECAPSPSLDCLLVESTSVNLRILEGRQVRITGTVARNNSETDMLVLVARDAQPISADTVTKSLDGLGITFTIPQAWIMEKSKTNEVNISTSGSTLPLITIASISATTLPDGPPYLVDGHHAIRIVDAVTASETVTVDLATYFLVLHFEGLHAPDPDQARMQWSDFLVSLRIASPSSASTTASGSTVGTPCGGAAGILCPSGEFCAISDVKLNIGRCVRRK